ncbi:hypothetical protein ACIPIN_01590 [Pseudomonas sp. NPDC087697]|uniref:hypothetical protein n=1 Tax=Pseudomonas sp. NPDC087697 TaxID=3364447 RepID=UPI00382C1D0B
MTNNFFSCGFRSVFFLALPMMGACSWAGQMAKDTAEGITSNYGSEHFTLVASLPANFGFTSKAQYTPKEGQDCQVYSPGLGGSVTRQQQKSDKTVAKNTEQTVSTEIPLEYHIAGCAMELARVDYEINATYGPDAWDHGLDHAGGLSVITSSTDSESRSYSNIQEQRALCTWLFQISTAKAKKDGIEKILSCSAADDNWKISSNYFERRKPGGVVNKEVLNQKTVKITFRQSEVEEPSKNNRWIQTATGWKPCQGTATSNRCASPPIFKTFKMNGRDCAVYPACSE